MDEMSATEEWIISSLGVFILSTYATIFITQDLVPQFLNWMGYATLAVLLLFLPVYINTTKKMINEHSEADE
jgi:ABC-type phosphate transport system permease subunit